MISICIQFHLTPFLDLSHRYDRLDLLHTPGWLESGISTLRFNLVMFCTRTLAKKSPGSSTS